MPAPLREIFRMGREEAEREFAPYFYQYFKIYFNSPANQKLYSDRCKHIFNITQAENKKVLDMGCGFGLISIHLATLGAKLVSAVDTNEEKVRVFQRILSQFRPPLDNIDAKLGDALDLEYEDNYFDTIIANEVISHVRDTDTFIREMNRILRPGGIFFISDGNNSLDLFQRYQRRRFWRGREYGPVDETSIRGTEKPIPWSMVRRSMIQEGYPQLGVSTLDLLAKETAGMYGDEISMAVEEYLREGRVTNKPPFKFRDPVTGEYNEFEFNPYKLRGTLDKYGFNARIVRPYSPMRPFHSAKETLLNLTISAIRWSHPFSVLIAPHFEIIARKR